MIVNIIFLVIIFFVFCWGLNERKSAKAVQQLNTEQRIKLDEECKFLKDQKIALDKELESLQNLREKQVNQLSEEQEAFSATLKAAKEAKRKNYDLEIQAMKMDYDEKMDQYTKAAVAMKTEAEKMQKQYEAIIDPIKLIQESDDLKKEFCITIPDKDKEDIAYLLKNVAPHLNNKDILAKLIWGSYIQKPLAETLKKQNFQDVPGIYKLTDRVTGKCYIGKSTTLKTRIQNHFKGACGISSISDQKIHHAMMEEGLDKWMIEKIIECDKEELSELEKYYIKFFNAQDYGYNVASGG